MKSRTQAVVHSKSASYETGWIHLAIIATIVVAIIATTGYVAIRSHNKKLSNSTTSSANATTQPSKTTDSQQVSETWPIYTDPYDGYSISYPVDWFTYPATREGSTFSTSNFDINKVKGAGDSLSSNQYKIEVNVDNNSQNLTLDQVVSQADVNNTDAGYKVTVSGQQTITNNNGVALVIREVNNITTNMGAYEVYAVHGNKTYITTGENNSNFKSTFDAVSQSIKFNP